MGHRGRVGQAHYQAPGYSISGGFLREPMRSPTQKPTRVFVVTPVGRILATHYGEGVASRYVDGDGRIKPRAEKEGFRLLTSFAKERPGFVANYTAFCDAAEAGEVDGEVPEEWIPPGILKLRAKATKVWVWPALPKKGAK